MNNNNTIELILLCLFVWFFDVSYAQKKGFLTTFSEENHSWCARDALEASDGNFVICAYDRWGEGSLLLRLSANGDVLAKIPILSADTTLHACKLLQLPDDNDGEFVIWCLCNPNDGSIPALKLLRFNEELDIFYARLIPCTFFDGGNEIYDAKFLLSDKSIFAALTSSLSGMPNAIFLIKFGFDGNLIICQKLERDCINSVCNLFKAEDDRIGLFGRFNPSHMGFLAFNDSLQLASRDSIFQWSLPEGGVGDFCYYSIVDMINSQAVMLPNSSRFVSARLSENLFHANGYLYKDDRSVILAKYNDDFHQPESLLITEHMNDSLEYPAFVRSMDFRKISEARCEVFQCSILNEFPQYGLLQPFPTGIVVIKTDQDLNVVWKNRYLKDGIYQAMTINATADGGCLVVGSVGDYQAQQFAVFALKINADGIVGLDEVQEESVAFLYPNPANEIIKIGGVEAKETRVYNTLGQCVMSFQGNEASVESLAEGVYLLRIKDGQGRNQILRLVVDK